MSLRVLLSVFLFFLFNLSYAASCNSDAADAAKQAYNFYNPVTKMSASDSKITFCYRDQATHCDNNFYNYKATAQCDTSTGKWKPESPSSMEEFYRKPHDCAHLKSEC